VTIWLLIGVVALVVVVVAALVVIGFAQWRSSRDGGKAADERHPQGYWMGTGIAIGMGIGLSLGLVMDNLALGMAMGAGIGAALGAGLEQRNSGNMRPLTDAELRARRWTVGLGIAVLVLGVAVFAVLAFVRGS
jgi:hypothetical protein